MSDKCQCELCKISRRIDAANPPFTDEQKGILNDLWAIAEGEGLDRSVAEAELDAIKAVINGGLALAIDVLELGDKSP